MLAYHFLRDDMTADAGVESAWTEGEERTIKGRKKISLCEYGYHSSPTPWDALGYAPGSVLCLVEISEPEGRDETKFVSRTRKLIKAVNIERQLREFACDVAEEALDLQVQRGHTVDERSRAAVEVARRFARGDASREALAAARAAARAAGYVLVWAAARDTAWAAARDAAWPAASRKFNELVEPLFADVEALP